VRETGRYGIEAYLKSAVAGAGGTTRKFLPARPGNPDQLVIWPRVVFTMPPTKRLDADIHFVETKAPGKKPRHSQDREHKRLRALGCSVFVLDTKEKIDAYVKANR
jgi:hypothetical protein